jgi:hypothetical protein
LKKAMGPSKNTNTKRDTRSVEQLEEARRFKKPKQHQLDGNDPNNEDDDDDYKEEHKGFDEDDKDDDEYVGAPVVVSRTNSSKGSTSRRMKEWEDDNVGYEDLCKKLSHSFSGSGRSFTPKPSSQKNVKSVHMVHILLQIVMKEPHTRNAIRMKILRSRLTIALKG